MPLLLSGDLPAAARSFTRDGATAHLLANQPVVWVSLYPWRDPAAPPGRPFPAVLDTGNNDAMLIPAPLFRPWAGVDPAGLTPSNQRLINGTVTAGLYGFNVRLHESETGPPIAALQTDRGVAVLPAGAGRPRLPNLGVRLLTVNRLTLTVSGDARRFHLRAPRGRRP
jgi:hypothetical protein